MPRSRLAEGAVVLSGVRLRVEFAANFRVSMSSFGSPQVDTNAAAGDQCTLRAAIQEANAVSANHTITFGITGTINLASALPNLVRNISINGPGSASLTVRRDTGGDYRIFTIQSTVSISGLTVTNGKSADGSSGHGADGGGISNTGTLTLTDVSITGNKTGAGAGNVAAFAGSGGEGGGIYNAGTLTMTNCSVTGNSAGAQVLRTIAEDSDLVIAERNRAFVLMQYFGYLRRNPNDSPDANHTGYEFWLNKLNEFQGNFVHAEMVKAFITASEYRQRFGQ